MSLLGCIGLQRCGRAQRQQIAIGRARMGGVEMGAAAWE